MTPTALDDRLRRIDRHLLTLLTWNLDIMTTLQELQDKQDALVAAAAEAKADAARQRQVADQGIGLMQAQSAAIADLRAQLAAGVAITQAQIDALGAKADQALLDMADANTVRDQVDVDVAAEVTANTPPADPAP
jgi:hypothetical protein